MFTAIPLMIVSFILYNLVTFGGGAVGADPLLATMFSMQMMSGGRFSLTMGDIIILVSLIMLFFEIMKSIVMVMALIDVLAGFSVSIRSAGRDVNYN
jgi:hypothetical protein